MEQVEIRNIFGKQDSKESFKGAMFFTSIMMIGIACFVCGIIVENESFKKILTLFGGVSFIIFPIASIFAWCDYYKDKKAEKQNNTNQI